MKVSIIVPVYKSEAYIRECVDSILAQTFRDFELILVDDGSPDGCGRILDEYACRDARVRVIHQENGGPGAARNAGLDLASCPYVYFPDSDDILDPELLETVIPRMDEGWDMAVFGFRVSPPLPVPEQEQMAYTIRQEEKLLLETDEKKLRFLMGPFRRRAIRWEVWNRVFRREIIASYRIRFAEDRRVFAEDMYFTYFYMAHCRKILLLPDLLYTYRRHEDSGSQEYRKHLMIYSSNKMTEAYYGHLKNSEDCRYLYEHFQPLYYLLHKGALRRLRRHQWRNGLSMEEARRVLRENIIDYPGFEKIMKKMFHDPAVRESYRKDRNRILQVTDRLYTEELFNIPGSLMMTAGRRALLYMLRRCYVKKHANFGKRRKQNV